MEKCIGSRFQKLHGELEHLELVHADICGPTRTPSFNDNRYFLLFVDDYTKMMWAYFLKQKSEAFNVFLQFKAFAEKQSSIKMKTL